MFGGGEHSCFAMSAVIGCIVSESGEWVWCQWRDFRYSVNWKAESISDGGTVGELLCISCDFVPGRMRLEDEFVLDDVIFEPGMDRSSRLWKPGDVGPI